VAPASVTNNSDGSTTYIYNVNGYQNIINTPPKDFNPLNASDSDLVKFGYPPRPTDSSQLQQWKSFVLNRKITALSTIDTLNKRNSLNVNTYPVTPPSGYDTASDNWSGWLATSSYNEWDQVNGHFIAPTYHSTPCSPSDVSSWVGLGGDGNVGLIQDGVSMESGYNPIPWYEWVGPNNTGVAEQEMPGVTVHQGDSMEAYVEPGSTSGSWIFGLVDFTTNTSNAVTVTNIGSYYNGTTAEFIDERPEVNNQYSALLNYSSDTWTSANVHDIYGYWNPVGNSALNPENMIMMDPSNNAMSAPSSLNSSGNGFTEYWHSCS